MTASTKLIAAVDTVVLQACNPATRARIDRLALEEAMTAAAFEALETGAPFSFTGTREVRYHGNDPVIRSMAFIQRTLNVR